MFNSNIYLVSAYKSAKTRHNIAKSTKVKEDNRHGRHRNTGGKTKMSLQEGRGRWSPRVGGKSELLSLFLSSLAYRQADIKYPLGHASNIRGTKQAISR